MPGVNENTEKSYGCKRKKRGRMVLSEKEFAIYCGILYAKHAGVAKQGGIGRHRVAERESEEKI